MAVTNSVFICKGKAFPCFVKEGHILGMHTVYLVLKSFSSVILGWLIEGGHPAVSPIYS